MYKICHQKKNYNEKYRELREDTTPILPEWTARNTHLWYAHGDTGHDRRKKQKQKDRRTQIVTESHF